MNIVIAMPSFGREHIPAPEVRPIIGVRELVLPPKPHSLPSLRLPESMRRTALQRYVIDVCDALARACRDQVGAILPDPQALATHFEAFTVEQARSLSVVLHKFYGAASPAGERGVVVSEELASALHVPGASRAVRDQQARRRPVEPVSSWSTA